MTDKKREKMLLEMCKMTFKTIRIMWGEGYKLLGDNLKRAIITERVFHIFTQRQGATDSVSPVEMSEYLAAMLNFCGIE